MKAMELQGERLELFNEIDIVTDEEIENAMRPLTHEEKMERLKAAEEDPEYYTQEEMRKAVASWRIDGPDEETENAMRPITHEDVKRISATWIK